MTTRLYRTLRLPVLALVAATLGSLAQAQSAGDTLTPTATFTPVFKFTETHAETLATITDPTDPTVQYPQVQAVDAMKLCIKASMAGQALADIGPDTGFSLEMGDLSVQYSLSDDPNYVAGNTSVFFPTHGWDANNQPVGTEGLALSWTADTLTIKLVNSANSPDDAGPFSPAFSQNYIGVTNAAIRSLGTLSLSFGSITGDASVYLSGNAVTTTQTFTSGGFTENDDLTQASLSGELDFTPPAVAVTGTAPSPDNSGATVVSGTAVDGHGVASVEVTTTPSDPASWQQANIDSSTTVADGNDWVPTTANWSFDVSSLGIGTSVISVRATDLSGNVSAPVNFTVVVDVPPALAGRWDALVTSDISGGLPFGVVTFSVSNAGSTSGRLTLSDSGRTFPFTGTWSGDTVTATINRPGLTSLAFSATAPSIDVSSAQDAWLDGSLTDNSSAAVVGTFGAFRSPYSASNPVSTDLLGRYNGSISGPQVTAALGTSFLSVNVHPSGSSVIAGRLSDGTAFAWSGRLGASGQVPVYVPLYGRKGLLSAALNVDGQSLSSDTGVWVRPPSLPDGQFPTGFIADTLSVDGQIYTAPVSPDLVLGVQPGTDNTNVDLAGDGLDSDINVWFTVAGFNRATFDAPNAEGLRMTFGASTGNVTGAFKLPDTATSTTMTVIFRGLIVGDQAVGYYVAPAAPGSTTKRYGSLTVSGSDASSASNSNSGVNWTNFQGGGGPGSSNGGWGWNWPPIDFQPLNPPGGGWGGRHHGGN